MNLQIDAYAHLDSVLHRWNPRQKLVALVALIFAFATVEDLALIPVMMGVTFVLYGMSNLPLSFLHHRLRYPGFFLLGIVLLLPWLSGETVIWQWNELTLREEGLLAVVLIASRFLCILTVGLVLLGTMPFLTTIKAMRSLGLPPLLADMTLLTYRYLYDVTSNLVTMKRAMRLRGFGHTPPSQSGQRSLAFIPKRRDLHLLASLSGSLFIRSYEQSEHIYKSMRLRGYGQAHLRSQSMNHHSRPNRAIAAANPLPPWGDTLLLAVISAIALIIMGLSIF
ncbi:MAG: cobalt ECF transporter T component CbiQ [Leptolyngbyaceae bacterium]|nr:cobalt ECF transporter T component CbiQ [Leptolyngbyaceae bacterium]